MIKTKNNKKKSNKLAAKIRRNRTESYENVNLMPIITSNKNQQKKIITFH